MSDTVERATALADYLTDVLGDEESTWPIYPADILDALASTGLRLAPDTTSESSFGHQELLKRQVDGA
jgi:hypothetical protein